MPVASRPGVVPTERGEAHHEYTVSRRPAPVMLSPVRVLAVRAGRGEPPLSTRLEAARQLQLSEGARASALRRGILAKAAADVVLLDARESRPAAVYRAIAQIRNAGWTHGIVLLVGPDELAMLPVAPSIGISDFVLSDAKTEEIEIRLRRAAGRVAPARDTRDDAAGAGIRLHWRTHQVSCEGTTISLTLRELQLLATFIEHSGELLMADVLAKLAWGKLHVPAGGLIAAYVCSLRKKLAWFGGRFGIRTVRGVGYRFVV